MAKRYIIHVYNTPVVDCTPWKIVLEECTFGTHVSTLRFRSLDKVIEKINEYKNMYNCTVAEHLYFPFSYLG